MTRLSFLGLILLLLYGMTQSKESFLTSPYSESHLTLNGFLEDWGGMSGFRAVSFADSSKKRGQDFNNEANFATRWNEHVLYLAFFVRDKRLNASTLSDLENARQDDGVEIWIDGANDSGQYLNENDYHLVVGLNNNVNEMRGKGTQAAGKHEQVPRILTRNLKVQVFVRPFGTVNQNGDSDSGYNVEMAIEWKSLGVDITRQRKIRIDVGVVDLDTNDFSRPETWTGPAYSGFMLCDRNYQRSPQLWAVLNLSEPPVISKSGLDDSSSIASGRWLALLVLLSLVVMVVVVVYYVRIQRIHREMRNQILLKLQQFLQDHYKEKISLDDFCKLYNYSESQVQKAFKAQYKTSFSAVLLQKRMEEAKRLLENTEKNVTEVCFEVGFNDASYFTKSFKSFFKILPKEVKKNRLA